MPGPRGGSGGRAGETRRRPLHCPSPALALAMSVPCVAGHPSVPEGRAFPVGLFKGVRGLNLTLVYLWASRGTSGWI